MTSMRSGVALRGMVAAGRLQRALDRLGAGVGEEDDVGEGRGAEAVGQRFLLGDAVDVRDVPQLLALPRQRLDQLRVRVAERVDGDAGDAVEIDLAVGRPQSHALAARRTPAGARL